jgi:RHH-type rel operon transcriptional repressor/antitoxin RelB
MLAIRLPAELETRLEKLAQVTGRSKTFYAREAIEQHLTDLEARYLPLQSVLLLPDDVQQALLSWQNYQETGESVDWQQVKPWMESWTTEQELLAPMLSCPCPK